MNAIIEFDCLVKMKPKEAALLGKSIRDYAKSWGIECKETIDPHGGVEYVVTHVSEEEQIVGTNALCHFINGCLITMGFDLNTWERKK